MATLLLQHHRTVFVIAALALLSLLPGVFQPPAAAQTASPVLTLEAEVDIGFDCPVSATPDPAGDILWVLMDNCDGGSYTLRGFRIADGSRVAGRGDDFAPALTDLRNGFVDSFVLPLAFTPDGALDIFYLAYTAPRTEEIRNIRLRLDGGDPVDERAILPALETLQALIPGYDGYVGMTVYSPDHTRAIAIEETRFTIIDLQAGTVLLTIDAPEGTFGTIPGFSADGEVLVFPRLNAPEDFDRLDSTLRLYSLPEGDLLATYDVPSPSLWLSPDRRVVAALLGDDQLIVTDLASGNTSQPIRIFEPPTPVRRCLNSGKEVSGVDYVTRGVLYLTGLIWLPDSSGFLTVNSYMGDGAQGSGSDCLFNYSRLRRYSVRYE